MKPVSSSLKWASDSPFSEYTFLHTEDSWRIRFDGPAGLEYETTTLLRKAAYFSFILITVQLVLV